MMQPCLIYLHGISLVAYLLPPAMVLLMQQFRPHRKLGGLQLPSFGPGPNTRRRRRRRCESMTCCGKWLWLHANGDGVGPTS